MTFEPAQGWRTLASGRRVYFEEGRLVRPVQQTLPDEYGPRYDLSLFTCQGRTLSTEVSSLPRAGYGSFPREFSVVNQRTGNIRRFVEYREDYDAEHDLRFVEYREDTDDPEYLTVIIFND